MADILDSPLRDALLAYARSQGLGKQDDDSNDDGVQQQSEDVEKTLEESAAAALKKTKMLRIARMLVDSNPRIRNKGMASVGSFLDSFQEVTEDELLHVWSTLYYGEHRGKLENTECFFRVLIAEWGKLDRHRTNKFLLFCRIFLAEWMHVMSLMKWEETFVKEAVEFLCEEVMLHGNARGVALHVVDVLTDEFQVLLDPVAHPASFSGGAHAVPTRAQEQEERLCAFSWLFVPFLRCCCFSTDSALVARIHERSLRKLGLQDVDLRFVAAVLFALATDKRVRSENRKQLFASHEHVKEEVAGAARDDLQSSAHRVGSFTAESFAQLMVQRVICGTIKTQQQSQEQLTQDPVKQFANLQKRTVSSEGRSSVAKAHSSPPCDDTASSVGALALSKNTRRAEKRLRLCSQPQQHQETGPSPSETQTADELVRDSSAHKAPKNKHRKMSQAGVNESSAVDWDPANGLRLPIVSSGTKGSGYATNGKRSSATSNEASSRSEMQEAPPEPIFSPSAEQSAEHNTARENPRPEGDCSSRSMQGPVDSDMTVAPDEQGDRKRPSLRRSLRISEPAPSNKRVLFNLRKNKVVAFSRHAPSLAVGPASPPPPKGGCRGMTSEPTPVRGSRLPGTPLRGILRKAKKLGPPTREETAPMPPIVKSKRLAWWDGSTEELMAVLRRALSKRSGRDDITARRKRKQVKRMRRAGRKKDTSVS